MRREGTFFVRFGIQFRQMQQQQIGMFLLEEENRRQGAGTVIQPLLGKGRIGPPDLGHQTRRAELVHRIHIRGVAVAAGVDLRQVPVDFGIHRHRPVDRG